MPSAARVSGGTEAWVMIAGCSMRLSTPPSDSAQAKIFTALRNFRAAGNPPWISKVSIPPKPFICFRASACWGWLAVRVDDVAGLGVTGKELGDLHRVLLVTGHADVQGLHPAEHEEAVHRRGTPPTAFWRKAIRWASSGSLVPTKPPTVSLCPLMYLVVECRTTSMPKLRADAGSTAREGVVADRGDLPGPGDLRDPRQVHQLQVGLVGVSSHTIRSAGERCLERPGLDRSTKLKAQAQPLEHLVEDPEGSARRRRRSRRRGRRRRGGGISVSVAARPEAKADPNRAPSNAARQLSRAVRVGFFVRLYSYPLCSPGPA
jgi:hypothetical protein